MWGLTIRRRPETLFRLQPIFYFPFSHVAEYKPTPTLQLKYITDMNSWKSHKESYLAPYSDLNSPPTEVLPLPRTRFFTPTMRNLYSKQGHCVRQAENHLFNQHHPEFMSGVWERLPLPPLSRRASDLWQQSNRNNTQTEGHSQPVEPDIPTNAKGKILKRGREKPETKR